MSSEEYLFDAPNDKFAKIRCAGGVAGRDLIIIHVRKMLA